MFNKKNLKSDYLSLFNKTNVQQVPSGFPCTFDSDCVSPSVCQFNVCTINIGGNEIKDLSNICKGKTIKDCAKEMQKEREQTDVPIYIPNYPSSSSISKEFTGGNGDSNIQSININSKCEYDRECNKNEVCITGVCVDKSNFPLIAKQKKLKSSINNINEINKQNLYTFEQSSVRPVISNDFNIKKYFEHKKTPLDGNLSPYEYMFFLEQKQSLLDELHDDYFYFNNK